METTDQQSGRLEYFSSLPCSTRTYKRLFLMIKPHTDASLEEPPRADIPPDDPRRATWLSSWWGVRLAEREKKPFFSSSELSLGGRYTTLQAFTNYNMQATYIYNFQAINRSQRPKLATIVCSTANFSTRRDTNDPS